MAPKQAGAIACNSLARNAPILIQHVGMQMVEKLGKLAPQRRGRPVRRLVKLEASQDSPQPAISPWLLSQLCLQRTPRWGEVAGDARVLPQRGLQGERVLPQVQAMYLRQYSRTLQALLGKYSSIGACKVKEYCHKYKTSQLARVPQQAGGGAMIDVSQICQAAQLATHLQDLIDTDAMGEFGTHQTASQ
ncbi:hypothetical protein ABBQ38_003643 [Trebouxia sp. C0009 RCD-2024]